MSRARRILGISVLGVNLIASAAAAQVTVSNLLEARAGPDPFDSTQPGDRTSYYDGLDLGYSHESLRLGLRYETERNSQDQFTYAALTQRFAEWTENRAGLSFRGRVGNVYTILGRGLIHRSFEVPGVVLDAAGPDSRYALARDVDGVLLEGSAGPVRARALAGSPNGATISPGFEEQLGLSRHQGHVAGGQLEFAPWRWAKIGAAHLRDIQPAGPGATTERSHGTGFVEFDPLSALGAERLALPFYAEYAQTNGSFADWFRLRTGDDVPHALYAGLNFLAGPFTLAAEWKDYDDFRLGTNDPPSLAREHAYALLNRNTHILNASSEQGYQVEASGSAPLGGTFTVNLSRGDGRFGSRAPRFESQYFELHVPGTEGGPLHGRGEATFFHERGRDEFTFITRREVSGAAGLLTVGGPWSVTLDLEQHRATRAPDSRFRDDLVGASLQRASWGTLGVTWERSTDPLQEDFERPGAARTFLAATLSARLSPRHEATILVGSRRGGLACTAGTCYEVPAFEGVELRLTSSL